MTSFDPGARYPRMYSRVKEHQLSGTDCADGAPVKTRAWKGFEFLKMKTKIL